MYKKLYHLLQKQKILVLVLSWFLILQSAALIADRVLPYDPSFPYVEIQLAVSGLPKNLYSWANFDGVHYLTIANEGYLLVGLVQAFFPVYPAILGIASLLGINTILFGIFINVLSLYLALRLWDAELHTPVVSEEQRSLSRTVLLLFPTSFFLSAIYSESIFLLLVVATFYSISRERWYTAAVLIGVATATRIVGVVLIPCALYALYVSLAKKRKTLFSLKNIFSIPKNAFASGAALVLLGSQGLLAYMYYLYVHYSDPFYFFNVQADFGGGRQEKIVLLPQVLYRYIKILATNDPVSLSYFASLQELLLTLAVIVGLGLAWRKKLVPDYQILFGAIAILIPTATGTLSSMPRYVLVALPAFTAFAWILATYPRAKPFWFIGSTFLLVFNTILFVQGYWVA